jgi:hypothetical protein
MGRLFALVAAASFCAPAFAADAPTVYYQHEPSQHDPRAEYYCVGKETFYPTYQNWIWNWDPYNNWTPQFYGVVSWTCDHERYVPSRVARRRAPYS